MQKGQRRQEDEDRPNAGVASPTPWKSSASTPTAGAQDATLEWLKASRGKTAAMPDVLLYQETRLATAKDIRAAKAKFHIQIRHDDNIAFMYTFSQKHPDPKTKAIQKAAFFQPADYDVMNKFGMIIKLKTR